MASYAIALACVMILAVLSGRRDIIASMIVVTASWMAWCLFILATEVYEPWQWGIVIDAAAAAALLRNPSSRPKAILAAAFITQIAAHIAYGTIMLTTGSADYEAYYTQTSLTGWAQLLICGGWAGGSILRRIVPWRRLFHVSGSATHRKGVGR